MENRIFGPPGTGKTHRLSLIVEESRRTYGENLLLASFTRAAARVLAARIPIQESKIGTLHAHAFRALSHPKIAELQAKSFSEAHKGMEVEPQPGVMDDPGQIGSQAAPGTRYLGEANAYRARRIPHPWPNSGVELFWRQWQAWKDDCGFLDFTDLIEKALLDVAHAPSKPLIGFFDEVQDFTALELALVRKWGGEMLAYYLAGDDDQCIYSFKGADPEGFIDETIKSEDAFLTQSYRLPRAIHDLAATTVDRLSFRKEKLFGPRDADGAVLRHRANFRSPASMVPEILGKLRGSDDSVMVLASCGYMLETVIRDLKAAGVPIHNPYRKTAGHWNPLDHGEGRRLAAYLRPDAKTHGALAEDWSYKEIDLWLERVDAKEYCQHGMKTEIQRLAKEKISQDERPGFDVVNRIFKPGVQWWSGRPETLRTLYRPEHRAKLDYPLSVISEFGREAIVSEPRVTVGTIHSVKGGEADHVYLFPDLSSISVEQESDVNGVDANIRMMYVGATRARETLTLMRQWGPNAFRF